jgi:putative toxin-antitoxin system antitoxin component (TIGR02293 family)
MPNRKSSTSGSPVATSKREGSGAPESGAKSVPPAKAAAAPREKLKPPVRPPAKDAALAAARRKRAVVALAGDKAAALSYITVYRATPLERIDMIRQGIPASEAKRMVAGLPIGQGAGFKALNLSIATVNRKAKQGGALSPEESERIVGFAKLVGQLEAMLQDSGDPTNFDARAWMARWLTEPLPAFGGVRPADLVDTMEGQSLVSAALAKVQSGAYA